MKTFTYSDYIKCIHTLRLNAVLQLAEENTPYRMEQKKNININKNVMKRIFSREQEVAKIINDFLNPIKMISSTELTRYTNSYIEKKYKIEDEGHIYKVKDKEMFFILKHQSTIDCSIPYRILNYCVDIMYINKSEKNAVIVPIIIYTGDKKWNRSQQKQLGNYIIERNNINLEYNLIEINKISNNFLLQKKSLFAYVMIIEKSNNKEEIRKNLELIEKTNSNKDYLNEIKNMIIDLLNKAFKKIVKEELNEKIEMIIQKGEENMSNLYERLINENKQMIEKGRLHVAEKLIENNVDDEIIIKSANISKKQLEKLKDGMFVINS